MTSIICLLNLVHLNVLLIDEWIDHVVKDVLKALIFVVQKAGAPKNVMVENVILTFSSFEIFFHGLTNS